MNPITQIGESIPDALGNKIVTSQESVTGGTLYITSIINREGSVAVTQDFVPTSIAGSQRFLALTNAKSAAGVSVTATPGGGVVGIARTAGTSLQLAGETTSASAVTDTAFFEFNIPDSYIAGSNIPLTVNAVVTGAGTLTAASTTITASAYTETNGVEAALTVSAAQQFGLVAADLIFTITGTNLIPGQHIGLQLAMLVTSSAGANTGYINSVSYQA